MQQIKIFKAIETGIPQLESQVNEWMAANKVRVIQITGNIAPQTSITDPASPGYITKSPHGPSDVLLVVLYEKL